MRDIDFPEGVLIGAVMKNGEVKRPVGTLRIEAGDVIALFAMADDVRQCAETSTVDGTVKRRPNAGVLAALLGASAVVGATLIGTGGMLPLA
jgi:hypothetical protein